MISGYVSRQSWLHRVPAGVKLLAVAAISIAMLPVADWRILAAGIVLTVGIYASLGREVLRRLGLLRPLVPILIAIAVLQAWFDSWPVAAVSVSRILLMVMVANLITLTTTMQDMMAVLSPLFMPLRFLKVNPRAPALAIALVIRFVPVLMLAWQEREEAWRARTGRRGSLRLIPSFITETIRMTDHIAESLDARGFDPSLPSRHEQGRKP
jgi:biotin transport system permease protein